MRATPCRRWAASLAIVQQSVQPTFIVCDALHHGVDLDLDEEVVADQPVDEYHGVRRLDRAEHFGVGGRGGTPVGGRDEHDACAHDVVEGAAESHDGLQGLAQGGRRLRARVARVHRPAPAVVGRRPAHRDRGAAAHRSGVAGCVLVAAAVDVPVPRSCGHSFTTVTT